MENLVYYLDVVTIIAAFCNLLATAIVWFKVDDVEEDIEDLER